ncbi:MAG: 3-phosphoglycerate dehydrogenase [Spirochaetaceae bacterium]|nr:MAG: 3-phosphoglycerate dehydrogenase [Spirochaetaceae bacterium]
MIKVRTYNKIAETGLAVLTGQGCKVGEGEADAQGIILRSHKLQPEEINQEVLAIARAGAGYNNVPVDYCTEKGIVVFNTPGANANGVKELVLAGLLLGSRKVYPAMEWVQSVKDQGSEVSKLVEKEKSKYAGPEIQGKTLGVIGLGAIGVLVANAASALGMNVIGHDPFLSVDAAWGLSNTVKKASNPDQVYQQSDFLSIHVPLNDKTRAMINDATLAKIKPGARILNFSRGELVDNTAVLKALDAGRLSAYITDFPEAELLGRDDVVAIPHLGASTPESEENCAIMAAHQVYDYLRYGNIKNSVNFPACSIPMTSPTRITITNKNIPAMVGQITTVLANAGINIEDMINRHAGDLAYNIIDVEGAVSEDVINKLKAIEGIIDVRVILA